MKSIEDQDSGELLTLISSERRILAEIPGVEVKSGSWMDTIRRLPWTSGSRRSR